MTGSIPAEHSLSEVFEMLEIYGIKSEQQAVYIPKAMSKGTVLHQKDFMFHAN